MATACVAALALIMAGACTSERSTAHRTEPAKRTTTVPTTRAAGAGASPTSAPTTGQPSTSAPTTGQPSTTRPRAPAIQTRMSPSTVIRGGITPKSVVASGRGVVFAQNMIYSHTITVYDSSGALLKTIPDTVDLTKFGITGHPAGLLKGGPVEMAFSADGKEAYVSNYSMYGPGFGRPGHDTCSPASGYDSSFVYRVNVARLAIDQVIAVGSVPKYVATTPDGKYVLVTNWCSYDLSVIDTASGREVRRLPIGPHPRGIAVDSASKTAYVAVMGGRDIVTVNLQTFARRTDRQRRRFPPPPRAEPRRPHPVCHAQRGRTGRQDRRRDRPRDRQGQDRVCAAEHGHLD